MKKCRECGVELVEGENWYPSRAKKYDYICIECHGEHKRQYRQEHHEECVTRRRQRYEGHQEGERERSHQWREANPNKKRESNRQWAKANPDKVRENCRRRRARKNGVTVEPVDEAAIYERDGHMCIYCGATENLELDHIVPLASGGAHCEDNLVVACLSCNRGKYTKPLEEWLQTQPKALAWVI